MGGGGWPATPRVYNADAEARAHGKNAAVREVNTRRARVPECVALEHPSAAASLIGLLLVVKLLGRDFFAFPRELGSHHDPAT